MHVPATIKFRGRLYQRVADGDYAQIGNLRVRRPHRTKTDDTLLANIGQQYHEIYTELDFVGDIITKLNKLEIEFGRSVSSDNLSENMDSMRSILSMWDSATNKSTGLLTRLTRLKSLVNELVEKKRELVQDA